MASRGKVEDCRAPPRLHVCLVSHIICHPDSLFRLPDLLHTAGLEAGLCCQVLPALRSAQKQACSF